MIEDFKNPRWRLNNLYSIVDKNSNKVQFKENSVQTKINDLVENRKMILKFRQVGVSTNELIKMFDCTIFNENVTSCILAHEQDAIEKLFRIVWRAYNFLPDDVKPMPDRGGGSKYALYFPEINSRIYVDLESRSDTINWLHCSEAAFLKSPDKLKATLQTVPIDGVVTLESTPNGHGNYFHDEWIDPASTFKKIFFPWYIFKEYSMPISSALTLTADEKLLKDYAKKEFNVDMTDEQFAFRRFKKSELKALFLQEYPENDVTCFLASGHAAMDLFKVKELLDIAEDPIEEIDNIKIYRHVHRNGIYVIGADTSEGVGQDPSAATVIDATKMQVVATVHGQLSPFKFAHILNDLAMLYRTGRNESVWPMIAVECNNHGHAVLLELDEHIRYNNLYYFDKPGKRLGWKTDSITRPIMLDTFIDAVENGRLSIPDKTILKECLTLVSINKKIQANAGKHDDFILSTSIALQIAIKNQPIGPQKFYI